MKMRYIFTVIMLCCGMTAFAANDPVMPASPSVQGGYSDSDAGSSVNIEIQMENSIFIKGASADLTGFSMTGLVWSGNSNAEQNIPIDSVKSIRIKGYTMQKATKDNLSVVFYFPYLYDIEFNDGNIMKDVAGKIKKLDNFIIKNSAGTQKCYTYFIRYWLEDKGEFAHNGSKDYNEKPIVPDKAVVYIEFNR